MALLHDAAVDLAGKRSWLGAAAAKAARPASDRIQPFTGGKRGSGLVNGFKHLALVGTVAVACVLPASAGDFSLDWDTLYDWPTNSLGPQTYTLTDQFGFQLDVRGAITQIGGTALAGYPDDILVSGSNQFGLETSLWVVWDAGSGTSGIGESTNTATLEILSGGSPFAVDALSFRLLDIDAVDNDGATDRCDFVTMTGNAGNPSLSYVSTDVANRSVIIGPGTGSGSTGAIAANQAQCDYNVGPTGSNTSDGDDNGSILVTYPSGTHTATIAFDESIENVYGVTSRDAAARGVGIWAGTFVTVNQSISLDKTTAATSFSASGTNILYTYTITNTGGLPINTGQNIQIQDDQIGTFTCGTISSPIPVGGTHVCTANYTTSAGDVTAGGVTNNATAGVGTGSQSFATRLQSNTDAVTVPYVPPAGFSISKIADRATVSTVGETITYTITVDNTGGFDLTNPTLGDVLLQNGAGLTLTSGPSLASGDVNTNNILETSETWVYTATYDVTEANLLDGNLLENTATFDSDQTTSDSDNVDVSVTFTPAPSIEMEKSASLADPNGNSLPDAGEIITYTLRIENTGNVALTNVTVSDPLPDISISGGPIASLAPGAVDNTTFTVTYALKQSDIDAGNIVNQATVSAFDHNSSLITDLSDDPTDLSNVDTEGDGDPDDPTDVPLSQSPNLSVVKAGTLVKAPGNVGAQAEVGDTINYTYDVTNIGNQTLSSLNISDVHNGYGSFAQPASETLVLDAGVIGDSVNGTPNDGAWNTLGPSDVIRFTATYTVTQQDMDLL